jgi:hypothetical protein
LNGTYEEVELGNINCGAIDELFAESWSRLLKNIADVNTKADAVRTVQITIKVKPSDDRAKAVTLVQVTEKLASLKPNEHFIQLGLDEAGRIHAFTSDPGQQDLGLDMGGKVTAIGKAANG